jgi:hypothetical protein
LDKSLQVWLTSPYRLRISKVSLSIPYFNHTQQGDYQVAQIYQQRWRIEDAFNIAKRLLGLAYFWVGSINGVQVQIWATWLLYAMLVDLTDQIAEAMKRPFADISMEMVFKGLYHFTQEKKLGRASDPVHYLVEDAKLLGILKHRNRPKLVLTNSFTP